MLIDTLPHDLTDAERDDLHVQEDIIQRGLSTFVEVGEALLKIRDNRLYRAEFGTFEDYCRERWGFTQQHATRLIRASEFIENISNEPIGSLPKTESQIRPMTGLEPDDQRLAWQLVTETAPKGKITAAHVQSVVNVLKEVRDTGALDPGTGEMLPLSEAVKAAITEETYERMKRQETYIAEKKNGKELANHQLIQQSNSNEWYTPLLYLEAARATMGGIDIDPASNEMANDTVRATTFYTADNSGLDHPWPGRVWLNPPYGGLSGKFVARLIQQFDAGITTEAIVLVNAHSTDTDWFAPLWAFRLCFTDHRINFISPDGEVQSGSTHGSVFAYLGPNTRAFYDNFRAFGPIVRQDQYD